MTEHERLRQLIGSYVLNTLEPAEARLLDQHLQTCSQCREEVASYRRLPDLLSRVDVADIAGATVPVTPPSGLLPDLLRSVEGERSRALRRLRRWQGVAALAAMTAAVGVAVATGPALMTSDQDGQPLVALAGAATSGMVTFDQRPWGSSVRLQLKGLSSASSYQAWATGRDGKRTTVATWGPTPDGNADVIGATPLAESALATLVVATSAGDPLLTLAD